MICKDVDDICHDEDDSAKDEDEHCIECDEPCGMENWHCRNCNKLMCEDCFERHEKRNGRKLDYD